MATTESASDLQQWLLANRQYIRSINEAGGDGSFTVSLPIEELRNEGLDDSDDVVVLPSWLAGQLGIVDDPVFEVYSLPLEG